MTETTTYTEHQELAWTCPGPCGEMGITAELWNDLSLCLYCWADTAEGEPTFKWELWFDFAATPCTMTSQLMNGDDFDTEYPEGPHEALRAGFTRLCSKLDIPMDRVVKFQKELLAEITRLMGRGESSSNTPDFPNRNAA